MDWQSKLPGFFTSTGPPAVVELAPRAREFGARAGRRGRVQTSPARRGCHRRPAAARTPRDPSKRSARRARCCRYLMASSSRRHRPDTSSVRPARAPNTRPPESSSTTAGGPALVKKPGSLLRQSVGTQGSREFELDVSRVQNHHFTGILGLGAFVSSSWHWCSVSTTRASTGTALAAARTPSTTRATLRRPSCATARTRSACPATRV